MSIFSKIIIASFGYFALFSFACAQTTIEGLVTNASLVTSLKLKYSKQGYFIREQEINFIIQSSGKFQITLPIEQDGVAYLSLEQKSGKKQSIGLYLQPKTTLIITFDATEMAKSITFQGTLQKENEHLQTNNKEYPTFYGKLGKQFMKDSVAIVCYNNIKKVKDEEISNFIKFAKNNNLHKKYIQYAKNDIDAYYMLLFNNIASYWFFDNTNGKSKFFLTGGWDKVAKDVLKPIVENINKESLKSLYMGSLKNPRFNGFWAYLYDITPTDEDKTPQAQEEGTLYKKFETKLTEVFKGEALEVQMANFISSIEMQKKYEIVLIGMIDRFKQHFPSSVYNESLEKAQKEVQLYHEQKNKPITNDIKIIEKYNDVNSFSALLEPFKGKVVLIDLWGTWCGSCKEEFKYLPALKEYFKGKDIVYLYIARENDHPNKEEKWLNMIKFHNLAGYHIIANKELLVDIWKQVATISDEEFANIEEASKETMNHVRSGKLQVYPNYLIVNVKGETVYKSAHHPSTKEKLYKQIETVLSN